MVDIYIFISTMWKSLSSHILHTATAPFFPHPYHRTLPPVSLGAVQIPPEKNQFTYPCSRSYSCSCPCSPPLASTYLPTVIKGRSKSLDEQDDENPPSSNSICLPEKHPVDDDGMYVCTCTRIQPCFLSFPNAYVVRRWWQFTKGKKMRKKM